MWTRSQIAVILAIAVITVSGAGVVLLANGSAPTGLLPFHSYGELAQFVDHARSSSASGAIFFEGARSSPAMAPIAGPKMGGPAAPSAPAYSGTNVQVAGVDEMDFVKTDGTYIYIASHSEVDILVAYPATDLHVVTRIDLAPLLSTGTNDTPVRATGLFLEGSHLAAVAVAGGGYGGPLVFGGARTLPVSPSPGVGIPSVAPLWLGSQRTYVFLFDLSNIARPALEYVTGVTGAPTAGRMVGDTIYVLTTQWIQEVNGTYLLPQVCTANACRDLDLGRVYHDPESADAGVYTNILAVDATRGASSVTAIITGGYSTLYMSPTAMYLSFFKWQAPRMGALMPVRAGASWTTIYKLRADGLDVEAVASANVAGSIRDQYSLDEWNGYLRVATTVRDFSSEQPTVRNDVYVLDSSLKPTGSVQGLAPGETIFAVRFVEDRAYVVTFRKIDPLFVLDLSGPSAPRVTGYLKMPGFSEYLHPLDAGHLLGVGKDAIPAEQGNFSWYQGLKLSLYDVSNRTHPTEAANVTIGDRGTTSEVLGDAHAFLYIPARQLVVLPVNLALLDPSQYPGGVPPFAWGNVVWQGAYVYRVNETAGFTFVGRMAHGNGTVNATYGWYDSPTQVRRSLYIGDTLYTISSTEVLASSLSDLSTVSSVVYATPPPCPYCAPQPVPIALP